jgi:hypothetical protein
MSVRVGFRLVHYKDAGLRRAPTILSKHLRGTLEGIGKRLKKSSISRMREDMGHEKKSLQIKVTGTGINLQLRVMSYLVQAFTDAYGLKRGTFPPFGPTSRLFQWAKRRKAKWETIKTVKQVKQVTQVKKVAHRPKKKEKVAGRVFKQSRLSTNARARAKDTNARRIAFLVARAIFRRGIKPNHWNQKALDANKRQINRDLQNGLERAVREINRG